MPDVLRCPKGHEGPFGLVEMIPGFYSISEIGGEDGKTITANGGAEIFYDAGAGPKLICKALVDFGAYRAECGEQFEIPVDWSLDWR